MRTALHCTSEFTATGHNLPTSISFKERDTTKRKNMKIAHMTNLPKTITSVLRPILLFLLAVAMAGRVIPVRAESANAGKVKEALKVMKEEAVKLGVPRAEGSGLYFGTTKINGNYTIVDGVKTRFNCTATFFVKKGANYVRISTNVLNDGNRAVGTVLDPKGPAYAAISKGEAFYGNVDILGKKYEAGYEPVKNAAGETIGVYYVGFLLE